jgi:type III pantothenate kinase
MLLVADVGNTNSTFGVYDPASPDLIASVRTATQHDRMPDEWYAILAAPLAAQGVNIADISAFVISSVVPSVTRWLSFLSTSRFGVEPIIVSAELDMGLPIDADNPAEVGADRIVNSIAALHRYGAPVIAVDFGTALNFDVVDHRGHYLGGALAPGLVIALEAMTSRAARLFAVDLVPPPHAIGRNTIHAIQSGLVLGYISLVEGMITRLAAELEGDPAVVVTGGYAELFAGHSSLIDHYDPDLTIDGLRMIWDRLQAPAH